MPRLTLRTTDGSLEERELTPEMSLGTAADNGFPLPAGLDVQPHHALITRSQVYQTPVLVDLAAPGGTTRVNGRRVLWLKALRHRDRIQLGWAELEFSEILVQGVTAGSPLLSKVCLVCLDHFQVGEFVVSCPRCGAVQHRNCWLLLSNCANYGCFYPVYEGIRRALARTVRFETLKEGSELIVERRTCGGRSSRDGVQFKEDDHVAYCPQCSTPFHAECWLTLGKCPQCGCDGERLIESALRPSWALDHTRQGDAVDR